MHGWRDMGQFGFLVLRDGAGTFQAVLDNANEIAKLRGLQFESVLDVEGLITAEPRAAVGAEMHDCRIEVLSPVLEPLPFEINKKEFKPGLDTFLDYAPIGLRNLQKRALFRISAELMTGYREYLNEQGFVEIQTPKSLAQLPRAERTCLCWTISGDLLTWHRVPSSTSRSWWVFSSACSKSGPSFGPKSTTRRGTRMSTSVWIWRWALSMITLTS